MFVLVDVKQQRVLWSRAKNYSAFLNVWSVSRLERIQKYINVIRKYYETINLFDFSETFAAASVLEAIRLQEVYVFSLDNESKYEIEQFTFRNNHQEIWVFSRISYFFQFEWDMSIHNKIWQNTVQIWCFPLSSYYYDLLLYLNYPQKLATCSNPRILHV